MWPYSGALKELRELGLRIIPLESFHGFRTALRIDSRLNAAREAGDKKAEVRLAMALGRLEYARSRHFARVIACRKPDLVVTHPVHARHLKSLFPQADFVEIDSSLSTPGRWDAHARLSKELYEAAKRKPPLRRARAARRIAGVV